MGWWLQGAWGRPWQLALYSRLRRKRGLCVNVGGLVGWDGMGAWADRRAGGRALCPRQPGRPGAGPNWKPRPPLKEQSVKEVSEPAATEAPCTSAVLQQPVADVPGYLPGPRPPDAKPQIPIQPNRPSCGQLHPHQHPPPNHAVGLLHHIYVALKAGPLCRTMGFSRT